MSLHSCAAHNSTIILNCIFISFRYLDKFFAKKKEKIIAQFVYNYQIYCCRLFLFLHSMSMLLVKRILRFAFNKKATNDIYRIFKKYTDISEIY